MSTGIYSDVFPLAVSEKRILARLSALTTRAGGGSSDLVVSVISLMILQGFGLASPHRDGLRKKRVKLGLRVRFDLDVPNLEA